jgi:hypothetical protein
MLVFVPIHVLVACLDYDTLSFVAVNIVLYYSNTCFGFVTSMRHVVRALGTLCDTVFLQQPKCTLGIGLDCLPVSTQVAGE